MDEDEGAPVEALDVGALEETVLFEDGDQLDVFLDRPGLLGRRGVDLGLEVDGYALVAVAVDQIEDFLERGNFGAGWTGTWLASSIPRYSSFPGWNRHTFLLRMLLKLEITVQRLDLSQSQVVDVLSDIITSALGWVNVVLFRVVSAHDPQKTRGFSHSHHARSPGSHLS